MAVELGTGYVSLVPSARGFGGAVSGVLDSELGGVGEAAGSNVSRGLVGSFATGLAGLATVGAAAVAGIGAAAFAIGSSFDDAFDTIRVTTGETGESLAGLEQSFRDVVRNVPADFGDASEAIGTLNQRLGLTGQPLEDLSGQLLNLSRITGTDLNANVEAAADLFNNWGIAAEAQAPRLDLLFRASQESGVAVDVLAGQMASSGVVLRDVGLSFDESAAFLATLGQAGVDTAEVMPALSRAMATAAREGRDSGQVFQWAFDQISNAPDQTAAAGVAMEVFGARAGPRLAAMIREGTLSYEDMLGSISAGGDTINAAAADTADFGEKWTLIKNRVLLALEPIATRVFDAVGNAMDSLGPVVDRIVTKVQELLPLFQERLAPIIAAVQTVFETVIGWFQRGGDEGSALGEKMSGLAEVFTSAFGAVQAVVETVVTILLDLWHRFGDDLIQFARDAWDAIVQVFSGVVQILSGVFDLIKAILTGKWGEAWDAIKQILNGAWQAINGILDAAFAAVRVIFETALGILSAAWSAIWNAIKTIASDIWEGIKSVISGGIDAVVGFVTGLPGRISGAISGAFDAIPRAFRSAINALIDIWNNFHIEFPGYDIPGPGPNIPGFRIDTPNIPHLAGGGTFSGFALVGEKGPELVYSPSVMGVLPNRMLGAAGGAGGWGGEVERLMDEQNSLLVEQNAILRKNLPNVSLRQLVRAGG